MTTIASFALDRLSVPLRRPYRLAFGPLHAFDTVLVRAETGDGRVGWGEATLVTGYTDETIAQSWTLACATARELVGLDPSEAKRRCAALAARAPFTATALATAVEALEGHPLLAHRGETRVELLALVLGASDADLEREIGTLLDAGYATLKVKVGFDAHADLDRVRRIRCIARGRARLRIDANQGFSRAEACRFAAALEPDGIELLEQTCAAGDWEAATAVAGVSTVPLMLDESIYSIADVERAAELDAARFVKLKLMKTGSLDALDAGLARIRALGMTPVLGNGVACDVGCWMEARVAAERIDNAGEMNGFLKPRTSLLATPMRVEGGALVLPAGFVPEIDEDAVARLATESARVEATAAAAR